MCGLTGIFDSSGGGRPVDPNLLRRMNNSLTHRGPDDSGEFTASGIGLAHRRLSIIDLSSAGRQPMFDGDQKIAVVYNGEIYNFQELRQGLASRGHVFTTNTDTEVIVHGWKEWGPRCVERFRGMFAFAVWDSRRRSLFLARDRFGIKPLYYARLADDQLIFASEMKALLKHPQLQRNLDPLALEEYFALGYVADPRSILADVKKLPAAHYLQIEAAKAWPQPRQYWDVDFRRVRQQSLAATEDELLERMAEAVKVRMVADVPVGAFLSGGVDSSGVVAMMAQASPQPVETCSISFGDPAFNEAAFARQVAEHLQTRHHEHEVDPNDFSLIDRLALTYDEPYADSSALPTYRVCELARRHVTVALSGDGGDEVFAGYRRHKWHMFEEKFRSRVPAGLRAPLFGLAGKLYPKADWAPKFLRAKSTFQAIARSSPHAYCHSVSMTTSEDRARLFSASQRSALQGYRTESLFESLYDGLDGVDPLARIQYIDMKTYLVGDILTKVDRASMAHSLEVRVPLLDHHFVEWAAGLPSDMKLRGGDGKFAMKRAVARLVPREVLYRPKMGFAVPLARWFREDLRSTVRERLLGGSLGDTGFFDMDMVESVVRSHQSRVRDYSVLLWSLLIFESFNRQVLGEGEP
jgi:asparagine synthase (glutamine-hydrolysing)